MATTVVTNGKPNRRNVPVQGTETPAERHFRHLSKEVRYFEGKDLKELKAAVQSNPTDENIYCLLIAVEATIATRSLLRHDTAHIREANTVN